MATTELFALALGLTAPWQVKDITLDAEAHRLDLDIDFHAGPKFTCPSCKRTVRLSKNSPKRSSRSETRIRLQDIQLFDHHYLPGSGQACITNTILTRTKKTDS